LCRFFHGNVCTSFHYLSGKARFFQLSTCQGFEEMLFGQLFRLTIILTNPHCVYLAFGLIVSFSGLKIFSRLLFHFVKVMDSQKNFALNKSPVVSVANLKNSDANVNKNRFSILVGLILIQKFC